jgi:choline dehydrogenase-like flavoprotein
MDELSRDQYIILIIIFIIIIIAIIIVSYQVSTPIPLDTEEADIIIVGGGTSACIIAYRLSQRYPNKSIIILERGRDRRNDPMVYNIANAGIIGYSAPYSQLIPIDFPNTNASVAYVNGGGSTHNFALVVRGSPDFYNKQWREQLKLSYNDLVQDYFPLIEAYYPTNPNETPSSSPALSSVRFQSGKVHMTQLPVSVSISSRFWPLIGQSFNQGFQLLGKALEILMHHGPLRASDTFSNAITNAVMVTKSIMTVPDYNADVVNCTSINPQLFVDNISGIRQSTDVAYLSRDIILFDKNGNGAGSDAHQVNGINPLQFVPNATVTKVNSNFVEWTNGTSNFTTKVRERVIMAAGAIYTPYILELSGFSNAEIGKDLTDHYGCTMILSIEPNENDSFIFSSGPIAFLPRNNNGTSRDWEFVVEGAVNQSLIQVITGISPTATLFSFI